MEGWEFAAGGAALAIAGFAARRWVRRLYAPPHGGRGLALTWAVCLGVSVAGMVLGRTEPIAGLGLFLTGPFAGIVGLALWREERNRAAGLPDDYVPIPERLGGLGRVTCAGLSLGSAWLAYFMADGRNWGAAFDVASIVAIAAGLSVAAVTGRLPLRLRRLLGAELTPERAAELRRRSLAHRLNPEEAIPLDEA